MQWKWVVRARVSSPCHCWIHDSHTQWQACYFWLGQTIAIDKYFLVVRSNGTLLVSQAGKLSLKAGVWIVNISGFVGHMGSASALSSTVVRVSPSTMGNEWAWLCSNGTLFMCMEFEFCKIHMYHKVLFFFFNVLLAIAKYKNHF